MVDLILPSILVEENMIIQVDKEIEVEREETQEIIRTREGAGVQTEKAIQTILITIHQEKKDLIAKFQAEGLAVGAEAEGDLDHWNLMLP